MSITLLHLEKNADVPVAPREEAGIYLTLRGTRGSCHNVKATYFPIHLSSGLIPLQRFECQPKINSQHPGSSGAPVTNPKRAPGAKFNSPGGLNPFDNSRGKQSSMPTHTSIPDSLFETAYTSQEPCQNRRGNLSLPPQLEMRPSSIELTPVDSRETHPKSTVFLTTLRQHEKLPEVTVTSRGNPGFPAST